MLVILTIISASLKVSSINLRSLSGSHLHMTIPKQGSTIQSFQSRIKTCLSLKLESLVFGMTTIMARMMQAAASASRTGIESYTWVSLMNRKIVTDTNRKELLSVKTISLKQQMGNSQSIWFYLIIGSKMTVNKTYSGLISGNGSIKYLKEARRSK